MTGSVASIAPRPCPDFRGGAPRAATWLAAAANAGYVVRMSELNSYTGGCQCGKVRYQVQVDLGKPVMACNCSMCGRAGTLLTFVPAQQFRLLSGEDELTDYQFNRHVIHHLFCKVCGIKSFARGKDRNGGDTVAINARCLDDVDVGKLEVTHFDGRSR
jgi:hypothetical protein